MYKSCTVSLFGLSLYCTNKVTHFKKTKIMATAIDTQARENQKELSDLKNSEFSHHYTDWIEELEYDFNFFIPQGTWSHYQIQFMAEQRAKEAAWYAQYKANKVCN